jgi:hypothetical protein
LRELDIKIAPVDESKHACMQVHTHSYLHIHVCVCVYNPEVSHWGFPCSMHKRNKWKFWYKTLTRKMVAYLGTMHASTPTFIYIILKCHIEDFPAPCTKRNKRKFWYKTLTLEKMEKWLPIQELWLKDLEDIMKYKLKGRLGN